MPCRVDLWLNICMSLKTSLRSTVYHIEKLTQRFRFRSQPDNLPILLGISFPKSGTHLLDQILLGFSKVAPYAKRLHSFYAEYEGESGRKRSPEQALRWLGSLRSGDVTSAHLFAREAVVERVCSPAFIPYFIFRDPRDVVVSHVFYVTDMEARHVHHEYYRSLSDFNARLKVSILGRADADIEFPNIADRFAPYLDPNIPDILKSQLNVTIHSIAIFNPQDGQVFPQHEELMQDISSGNEYYYDSAGAEDMQDYFDVIKADVCGATEG